MGFLLPLFNALCIKIIILIQLWIKKKPTQQNSGWRQRLENTPTCLKHPFSTYSHQLHAPDPPHLLSLLICSLQSHPCLGRGGVPPTPWPCPTSAFHSRGAPRLYRNHIATLPMCKLIIRRFPCQSGPNGISVT